MITIQETIALFNSSTIFDFDMNTVSPLNKILLDSFSDELENVSLDDLKIFRKIVGSNLEKSTLNSEPIIFILYYLANNNKNKLINSDLLTTDEIRPIFTQMGISTNYC